MNRRIRGIVGTAALALLASAPGAGAAQAHCLQNGDKVLAKSHRAVVFDRSTHHGHGSSAYTAITAFGCWRATGQKVRLGIDDDDLGERVTHVRIAGRFVGFASVSCDGTGSSCSTAVYVWNVKKRTRRRHSDALQGTSDLYDVRSLVLKRNASVAWIARDDDADPTNYQVRKIDADGHATLASGHDINGGSLRLHESELTWKQGGSERHATLR